MKNVKVTKHTRNMIETYRGDGETVNDCIGRLRKSTEPLQKMDRTETNIHLSEDNLNILRGYKSYPTESHSDTIRRLILQVQDQ